MAVRHIPQRKRRVYWRESRSCRQRETPRLPWLALAGLLFVAAFSAVACDDPGTGSASAPGDTETKTQLPTATPTVTPTPTPLPTPTPPPTPTPTPTATPSPTPTANGYAHTAPTLTPIPAPKSEPSGAATLSPGPGEIILENAIKAMAAVESFHFEVEAKLTITSQGVTLDVPIDLAGDFQAPDRTQGTFVVSFFLLQIDSEFINIGDASYTTDPDTGQWTVGRGQALSFLDPAALVSPDFLAGGGRLANMMLVGTDTLADTPRCTSSPDGCRTRKGPAPWRCPTGSESKMA